MSIFTYIGVIFILLIGSCSMQKGNPNIHERHDEKGRVVERWGNYHESDNDDDFRGFFYYDSIGRLVKEKLYLFSEPNPNYEIIDSTDYIETIYEYDRNGNLITEKKYFPQYDSSRKVISHELEFHYDHRTGKTIVPEMDENE
jgi:hypothetical protein